MRHEQPALFGFCRVWVSAWNGSVRRSKDGDVWAALMVERERAVQQTARGRERATARGLEWSLSEWLMVRGPRSGRSGVEWIAHLWGADERRRDCGSGLAASVADPSRSERTAFSGSFLHSSSIYLSVCVCVCLVLVCKYIYIGLRETADLRHG